MRTSRLALLGGAGLLLALSVGGALLARGELAYLSGGAEQFVRQRLSIGSKDALGADVSASSRSQLARHALELFGERPLTGHGVGATVEWREPESTHNIYLRHLAEYGFVGAWLAPALVLIGIGATRATRASSKSATDDRVDDIDPRSGRVFVVFVALWGVFSHNMLDDAFVLIGLAIVAGGVVARSVATRRGASV